MTVLMFKPRFAPMVRAYTKLQTIRPPRKRPIIVDDHLLLRQWAGKPYRSPQLALGFGRCTAVHWIVIGEDRQCDSIRVNDVELGTPGRAELSRADGFECTTDMLAWFEEEHGLPFTGVLIRWEKAEALP